MSFKSTLDDIYIWPCDTVAFGYELEEMLEFMSDDYIVVKLDDCLYDDVANGTLGYDDVVNAWVKAKLWD